MNRMAVLHWLNFILIMLIALPAARAQSLQRAVEAFTRQSNLRHAGVGISVVDVATGRVVATHNAEQSLIPASTLKLVTTATAIEILGADYRYETRLETDGVVDEEGVLRGDLYIVGSGDPTLGSPEMDGTLRLTALLDQWRLVLQQAGIRRIDGRIIGDGTLFGSEPIGPGWQWTDIGNYYGTGVYGLNVHENLYYLYFQQRDALGTTPPVAATYPAIPGLVFRNELRSAPKGTGDQAYIYGGPYTYLRYIRGTIPVGDGRFVIKGSMPDPPLLTAQLLRQSLEEVGILTLRPAATARELNLSDRPRTVLHRHKSPPLSAIIDRANKESVNLYVEALLRTIGLRQNNDPSLAACLDAVYAFWRSRGIEVNGLQLRDGSGLAGRNFIPASLMTAMLVEVADNEDFRRSLAVAGRSGTVEFALRGTAAEGRLQAKSGSLDAVRAFAGYAVNRSGQTLAFAIMVNNYDGSGGVVRQQLYKLMAEFCK